MLAGRFDAAATATAEVNESEEDEEAADGALARQLAFERGMPRL